MVFLKGGAVSDRIENPWIKSHLESSTPRVIHFTLQSCVAILPVGNLHIRMIPFLSTVWYSEYIYYLLCD